MDEVTPNKIQYCSASELARVLSDAEHRVLRIITILDFPLNFLPKQKRIIQLPT